MGGGGLVKVQVHLWNEWEQGHVGRDPTLEVVNHDYYPGMLLLRSGAMDCWEVAGIMVEQGEDGLVRVERLNR